VSAEGKFDVPKKTNVKIQALGLALSGFALLSVGDALAKSMAADWPGTAIATLRYIAGALGLAAIIWSRHGVAGFSLPMPWVQFGRGAAVALGSVCFFVGIHYMPLAEATVIQFTNPVITAILSALFLRESAPRAVWVATGLASAGVVLVLKPGLLHLGPAALLPLGTAFGMACMMILNRKAAGMASVLVMQFLISAMAIPFLIGLTAAGHFSGIAALAVGAPKTRVIVKCLVMAVTASTAHGLIFAATERASAALVAPMTYVQLLTAVVIGWVVFGNLPGAATYAGSALVIAGGLYLWWSERRAEQR
jgi:drug/metabolite transporter (DMT)-like permease